MTTKDESAELQRLADSLRATPLHHVAAIEKAASAVAAILAMVNNPKASESAVKKLEALSAAARAEVEAAAEARKAQQDRDADLLSRESAVVAREKALESRAAEIEERSRQVRDYEQQIDAKAAETNRAREEFRRVAATVRDGNGPMP
jgi:4-alpha-glucanotransferase